MLDVRRAKAEDAAVLGELGLVVHALHVAERPEVFEPLTAEALAGQWFRPVIDDPEARVWIAEVDGRRVGYVLVRFHARQRTLFIQAGRRAELEQIAVLPSFRRRGVGRALVEAALADARASGFERLEAVTWAFNAPARALFARLGFGPKVIRWERGPDASAPDASAPDAFAPSAPPAVSRERG